MSHRLVIVLSILLLSPLGAAELQQEQQKVPKKDRSKEATVDLGKVDDDFALQGEYMGPLHGSWRGADMVGLQVVALGGGKFDAVLLRGGLPGAGWDRGTKIKLHGERQTDVAVLRQDDLEITVTGQAAIVKHNRGTLGQVRKWHRISPTQDSPPPPSAMVLFDGRSSRYLKDAKLTPDHLLEVGAMTKMPVGDFQMHAEFRTPYMPYARGQGRGNSGIYIQQRYEVQVLDSFGLDGVDNECGGLYKQRRPAVNMCLPPLAWQTYDIYFSAARWNSNGVKVRPARITVLHNGEPVHSHYELTAKTGGGKAEGSEPFPILFQNHNNPVHFRNIWMVAGGSSQRGYGLEFASTATTSACEGIETYPSPIFGRRAMRTFW